jgi:hypothetical protein
MLVLATKILAPGGRDFVEGNAQQQLLLRVRHIETIFKTLEPICPWEWVGRVRCEQGGGALAKCQQCEWID